MAYQTSDDPYTSAYPPGCDIDPDIKAFIRHYYTQVDTQGKHVEYSECWSKNGTLIIPSGKEFRGRDGNLAPPAFIYLAHLLQRYEIFIRACGMAFQNASTDP